MLNLKIIAKILGTLLLLEALLLLTCLGVGLLYHESDYASFVYPALLSLGLAGGLKYFGRKAENRMGRRDGYLIVSLTWIIFSFIGALPFMIGGYEDRFACAFFESMSGFTTTGASIFNNIDALPHSILFWRSISHWFGGMGIVFFTIALLPQIGMGDLKLFSAEATGLKTGKLHPRISTTARWLWGLYLFLTAVCSASLWLGGMNLFDAINHGMSTVATGGFSTHQDSLAFFQSPSLEYIVSFFMILSGINFTLLYLLIVKRRWREVFEDGELKYYLALIAFCIVYCTAILYFVDGYELENAFRAATFQVSSMGTTTGFTTENYMSWHHSTWFLILFISLVGGCAGSTSGGVKAVRIYTAYKYLVNEFKRILHPRAVIPIRLNHSVVNPTIVQSIFSYFTAMFLLLFIASVAMMCLGVPMLDAVCLGITAFSNTGPSIGWLVGPPDSWGVLSDPVLWINSFLMLAGRLEIFSLLLPFAPAFWKEQ